MDFNHKVDLYTENLQEVDDNVIQRLLHERYATNTQGHRNCHALSYHRDWNPRLRDMPLSKKWHFGLGDYSLDNFLFARVMCLSEKIKSFEKRISNIESQLVLIKEDINTSAEIESSNDLIIETIRNDVEMIKDVLFEYKEEEEDTPDNIVTADILNLSLL